MIGGDVIARARSAWDRYAADWLDAATDRRCPGCGGRVARREHVCAACDAAIPRLGSALCLRCLHEPPPAGERSADGRDDGAAVGEATTRPGACPRHGNERLLLAGPSYEPPVPAIVRAFKYEGFSALAPWVSSLVPTPPSLDSAFRREALIVPLPLHPARRAARGYDQAALMAKECGRWWGVPVLPLLQRIRETKPQARLDPELRRSNTAGAFRLDPLLAPLARDRPLLLVDDVATTGATLLSAAASLESGRPAWILALTASHGGAFDTAQSTAHAKVATPGGVC